eukprot:5002732-Alexandrium_andersonii.AAC.1
MCIRDRHWPQSAHRALAAALGFTSRRCTLATANRQAAGRGSRLHLTAPAAGRGSGLHLTALHAGYIQPTGRWPRP